MKRQCSSLFMVAARNKADLQEQQKHNAAISNPIGFERAVFWGLTAWVHYAEMHEKRYQDPIGHDGVLGESWLDWGRAMNELLNGETGRLNCGHLNTFIRETVEAHGMEWPA